MRDEGWHRRLALEIVAQLPEDPKDARIVLETAGRLVDFIAEALPLARGPPCQDRVLAFPVGGKSPSS